MLIYKVSPPQQTKRMSDVAFRQLAKGEESAGCLHLEIVTV